MEPLSLEHRPGVIEPLIELASSIIEKRKEWSLSVRTEDREIYSRLRPGDQCLRSNEIEGISISLDEVWAAIKYTKGPKTLARAHILASQWANQADLLLLGINQFLLKLHQVFVENLPRHLCSIAGTKIAIEPGRWRSVDVRVGVHVPPRAVDVVSCMHRLEAVYRPLLDKEMKGRAQLVALVHGFVVHHRLAWIHPFDDYNGRLSRIFLDKWLSVCDLPGAELTTVSTGFAKDGGQTYKDMLHNADQPRAGALDGRGNLSERELFEFVRFGLNSIHVEF